MTAAPSGELARTGPQATVSVARFNHFPKLKGAWTLVREAYHQTWPTTLSVRAPGSRTIHDFIDLRAAHFHDEIFRRRLPEGHR